MFKELAKLIKESYPILIFILILWIIQLYQWNYEVSFADYGLFPRTISGLKGIVLMPFIHGDFKHLISNSLPLIVLGLCTAYFYPTLYKKVAVWIIIAGGFWLWLGGRPSYHVGASGLVYGLSSFLFFSGLFRKYGRLMAISLLIVFLYGGMIWGIFPLFKDISWEGHLFGGIAGALMAWVYRKEGPQAPVFNWDDEEEDDDDFYPTSNFENSNPEVIKYIYKPNPPEQKDIDDNEQN